MNLPHSKIPFQRFAAKECLLQHIGGVPDGEKHHKTDRKTLKGRQYNKLQLTGRTVRKMALLS